jgi:ribosomal protein S12 methylthiotransferase
VRGRQPPTLAFVTLGCPRTTVDSENMLGLMVRDGFRTVADREEADVAVVNTCAFLQSAVRESRETIAAVAELKRDGSLQGSDRHRMPRAARGRILLADFPEVDAVLGTGPVEGRSCARRATC